MFKKQMPKNRESSTREYNPWCFLQKPRNVEKIFRITFYVYPISNPQIRFFNSQLKNFSYLDFNLKNTLAPRTKLRLRGVLASASGALDPALGQRGTTSLWKPTPHLKKLRASANPYDRYRFILVLKKGCLDNFDKILHCLFHVCSPHSDITSKHTIISHRLSLHPPQTDSHPP